MRASDSVLGAPSYAMLQRNLLYIGVTRGADSRDHARELNILSFE